MGENRKRLQHGHHVGGPVDPAPVNLTPPVVSGTPQQGQTLTITPGTYSGSGVTIHRFIERNSPLPLPPPAIPVNQTPPTVSGTAQQGQTLTIVAGTYTNSPTIQRFVMRGNVDIQEDTTGSYVLQAADVGFKIKVREVAVNASGSATVFSNETADIVGTGGGLPINTAVPTITGTMKQGQHLTFTAGTYTGSPTPTVVRYVQRDQVDIGTDTDLGYGLALADVGHKMRLKEVATNTGGSITIYSAETATVQSSDPPVTYPTTGEILPTGGQGGAHIVVSTLAALRAELQNPTTDPRQIYWDPAVNITLECSGYVATIDGKKNFDIIGHRGVIFKDGCILFMDAENCRVLNCAFRPGDDTGGVSFDNRDGMEIRSARNMLIQNCDFSWWVDEGTSIIRLTDSATGALLRPFPHRVRISKCAYYQGLVQAGHLGNEPNHDYGPLFYRECNEGVCDMNVFMHLFQRNPIIEPSNLDGTNRGKGMIVQNNLIAFYGQSGGGGGVGCATEYPANDGLEAVIRGNLGDPADHNNAVGKARLVTIDRIRALPGNKVYIAPLNSTYTNHFCTNTSRASEPYDPATAYCYNGGEIAVVKTTAPFTPAMSCMPTDTQAHRDSLYDLLIGPGCITGVRNFTGDIANGGTPIPGYAAMTTIGGAAYQLYHTNHTYAVKHGAYPNGPPPAARVDSAIDFTYVVP